MTDQANGYPRITYMFTRSAEPPDARVWQCSGFLSEQEYNVACDLRLAECYDELDCYLRLLGKFAGRREEVW